MKFNTIDEAIRWYIMAVDADGSASHLGEELIKEFTLFEPIEVLGGQDVDDIAPIQIPGENYLITKCDLDKIMKSFRPHEFQALCIFGTLSFIYGAYFFGKCNNMNYEEFLSIKDNINVDEIGDINGFYKEKFERIVNRLEKKLIYAKYITNHDSTKYINHDNKHCNAKRNSHRATYELLHTYDNGTSKSSIAA